MDCTTFKLLYTALSKKIDTAGKTLTYLSLPLHRVLFFLCTDTTCAIFNLAGKTDVSKDLLINSVIGFTTAGLANFSILEEISS